MSTASAEYTMRMFVILNPAAGRCTASEIRDLLGRHFSCTDGSCTVHVTTGHDDLASLARDAAERGCSVIVAAGGDGTVSAVADGLMGGSALLGIIPLGTANVLAGELGIPTEPEGAVALLAGPWEAARVDALKVGDRHALTQVGVGLDALMIRDTTREQKRRFGRLAYLWTAAKRLIGLEPRRFTLVVDGHARRLRAMQVIVANSRTMGLPPFRWGPDIRPDDGRAALCAIRARTLSDYLSVAWHFLRGKERQSRHLDYMTSERAIRIDADPPLPVQADGEIVGQTPVEVEVLPGALGVLVPPAVPGPDST